MQNKKPILSSFHGLDVFVDRSIPDSAKFGIRKGDKILVSKAIYDCIADPDTFKSTIENLQVISAPTIEDLHHNIFTDCDEHIGKQNLADWRIGY